MTGETPALHGGPPSGLPPGYRVAGYRLERLVGLGGMAAVYQARDERLGRLVALKVLAGDEPLRSRFVREARAVAAVDHPHIIPVYEAGEADGMQYIAMRFVAGGTLQGILADSGALPAKRAVAFISSVASALDAAHAAGLVHRDVKPGTSWSTPAGRPEHAYLSDFGIARAMMSAGTLTLAGQFLGTPDYAAPGADQRPAGGRPGRPVRARLRRLRGAHRDRAVPAGLGLVGALRPPQRAAPPDRGPLRPACRGGQGAGPGAGQVARRALRQLRRVR